VKWLLAAAVILVIWWRKVAPQLTLTQFVEQQLNLNATSTASPPPPPAQ